MILEQPKVLEGPWELGCALDKHTRKSVCIGHNEQGHPVFETDRTPMGEALFQLKYRNDHSKADAIAEMISKVILTDGTGAMRQSGLIVPMPASTARRVQPVTLIATAVGAKVGIPVFDNVLQKAPNQPGAPALKNIHDADEKMAALEGRLSINDILIEGRWDAIIIDDLYDSGASMKSATNVLKSWRKINNVFAICCTWK